MSFLAVAFGGLCSQADDTPALLGAFACFLGLGSKEQRVLSFIKWIGLGRMVNPRAFSLYSRISRIAGLALCCAYTFSVVEGELQPFVSPPLRIYLFI